MTETATATATETPQPSAAATALAVRDPELDRLARLGRWLALAESKSESPEAKGAGAALRLYYADQLALPPLAAAELSLIGGRLVISARLLRALAQRAGYRVVKLDTADDRSCTATIVKDDTGEELGRATFTIEDAKKAGLIRDRSAWVTHPGRMLWARASAFVIYDHAPEVALGLYTEEELDDVTQVPAPPAQAAVAVSEPPVEEAEWEATQSTEGGETADEAETAGAAQPPQEIAENENHQAAPATKPATRQQHAKLGALIADLEAKWPTKGAAEPWEDWTRSRARELFRIESRAELTYEQMSKLIGEANAALEQGDQARIPF